MMDLRDSLAAQIAATLAQGGIAPPEIARRAYAVADAMLFERAEPCLLDEDFHERLDQEAMPEMWEDEPVGDPRWELSPRWSREDRAALETRRAGPGLAKSQVASDEDARRTGSR